MSTAHNNQRTYTRFSIFQRVEHFILILSFTILGLTGLPQKFPTSPISVFFVDIMGGIEAIRIIHRVAATVFLLEAIYHVVVVGYKLFVQRKEASMLPGIKDAQDAVQWFTYNMGWNKTRPQMPRYNFMEKAEYWAMIWGLIVMAITGFMLWNPIATTRILPGEFIPAAKAAHGGEGLLAVLAIILWHFYHVHIKQFNRSMFTGQMPRHEMEEEHGQELAAIEAGRRTPEPSPAVVRSRTMLYAPIAAIVSLAMLAGVYWFISFEESAITTVPPAQQAQAFSPQTPTLRPTATITPTREPTATAAPTEPGQEEPQQPGTVTVAWDSGIGDLFAQKCSSCHGQIGGYNAETYEAAVAGITPGDPDASQVVEVQSDGGHPGQFSDEELQQVMAWIEAGAPETGGQASGGQTGGQGGEETSTSIAWENGVGAVFEQKCSSCHGQIGGFNAESYEEAIKGIEPGDPDASSVVEVQEAGGHPGMFSDEELAQVIEWIEAGAPQAAEEAVSPSTQISWNGGLEETLQAKCSSCHGNLGGFSVDSYDKAMGGIKPGDPEGSSLVQVQQEGGHPGMLTDAELAQVIEWIEAGAPQE